MTPPHPARDHTDERLRQQIPSDIRAGAHPYDLYRGDVARRDGIFVAIVVVAAAAVTVWRDAGEQSDIELPLSFGIASICRTCGSIQIEGKSVVERTHADADLLDGHHKHIWAPDHVRSYDASGRMIGSGPVIPERGDRNPNAFVVQYNRHARFRSFIQARIAAGALERFEFVRIARLTDLDDESARALLAAYEIAPDK